MKTRRLKVEQQRPHGWLYSPEGANDWVYKVAEVDDAVDPQLGQILSPEQLSGYCDNDSWLVQVRFAKI